MWCVTTHATIVRYQLALAATKAKKDSRRSIRRSPRCSIAGRLAVGGVAIAVAGGLVALLHARLSAPWLRREISNTVSCLVAHATGAA